MKRPSITTRCPADHFVRGCERIAEFTAPNGLGGLIRVEQRGEDKVTVEVYRCDPGVSVIAPHDPAPKDETAVASMPAPWGYDPKEFRVFHADGDVEATIAWVDADNVSNEKQAHADGRVLAAAPDMLAALKLAEERLELNNYERTEEEALRTIRAAIAKAEGGASPASGAPRQPTTPPAHEYTVSGPEEGDEIDVSVQIIDPNGFEVCTITGGGDMDERRELAEAVVAALHAAGARPI